MSKHVIVEAAGERNDRMELLVEWDTVPLSLNRPVPLNLTAAG